MKGFTLMETIIVIAITAVLSALVLGYTRSGERQIALYKDQAAIVGFLNQAKSLAIQKYNQPGAGGYVACAFGVHFESPNTFILFQDLASGSVCPSNMSYSYTPSATPTEIVTSANLEDGIVFSGLSTPLDIEFIPPELNVTSTVPNPTITIQGPAGVTVSVTVGSGGQIVVN